MILQAQKRIFPLCFALILLAFLILFPRQAAQGIEAGLLCCAHQLIPALFPFLVVSDLAMTTCLARWLGILFLPYTRYLLRIKSSCAAGILPLSFFGGFSVCAGLISQLYLQQEISRRDAQVLLLCCAGSGAGFVINTVGLMMLDSRKIGVFLFIALVSANLCCGLFASLLWKPSCEKTSLGTSAPSCPHGGIVEAIQRSTHSMLIICGFVVFFSFLSACLKAVVKAEFPQFIFSAFLEVTNACQISTGLARACPIYCCCFALSILSLSVFLQIRALLNQDIPLLPLFCSRPFHLLLSFAFLKLLLFISPVAAPVVSTMQGRLILRSRLMPDSAFVLFMLCCAVLHFTSHGQWAIMFKKQNSPPPQRSDS